jgi:type II secretory pathway component PulJ
VAPSKHLRHWRTLHAQNQMSNLSCLLGLGRYLSKRSRCKGIIIMKVIRIFWTANKNPIFSLIIIWVLLERNSHNHYKVANRQINSKVLICQRVSTRTSNSILKTWWNRTALKLWARTNCRWLIWCWSIMKTTLVSSPKRKPWSKRIPIKVILVLRNRVVQ